MRPPIGEDAFPIAGSSPSLPRCRPPELRQRPLELRVCPPLPRHCPRLLRHCPLLGRPASPEGTAAIPEGASSPLVEPSEIREGAPRGTEGAYGEAEGTPRGVEGRGRGSVGAAREVVPAREIPARRAEFIQPGVSTPGGTGTDRRHGPIPPADTDRGRPPALPPGVDTPGWINSALRAVFLPLLPVGGREPGRRGPGPGGDQIEGQPAGNAAVPGRNPPPTSVILPERGSPASPVRPHRPGGPPELARCCSVVT